MQSLRILIPTHVLPEVKSVITMLFENLLPVMRNKVNVHVIWLVYQPEKILSKSIDPSMTLVDIHDYNNAVEILKKEKPDVVFADATRAFIDYALSSAAKFFNIPVFSYFWSDWYASSTNRTTYLKLNMIRFFEKSVLSDVNQQNKQIMRRGRFYIYKYFFLLRTFHAIKMTKFKIIKNFFILLKLNLFDAKTDARFANTLHFLEDERLRKELIERGFEKSSLIVTGNPIFDKSLQISFERKIPIKTEKIVRVLFAPSTLYEHGFWTKEQRDNTIKEILAKILEHKNEFSLTIKIHPSTSRLSEYQSIINSIDPSIPLYQKGDIQEFLENTDLIITFQSSTAEVYALIAKKPIIICNFFNAGKDLFIEKDIALECKDPSNLIKSMRLALSLNQEYEQKRENFIQEFMYKSDGRAAERICDKIMTLLEQRKINH